MTTPDRNRRRLIVRPVTLESLATNLEAPSLGSLGEVVRFIRRFVVVSPEQLVAIALWVVHAHAVEAAEQTPYLLITSPEKQCGKTRLLEVLALVVPKPWPVVTPSEAVVYRYIEATQPTLLLDEIDTIFGPRSSDKHEGLRALLNMGNRRGETVPRCVGPTSKVKDFSTYCAKALAGIGSMPDTIADRSIPIRLARRGREEVVERLRRRNVESLAEGLRSRIAEWADESFDALETAEPDAPEELSDRMQDACEPLLAIADRLGGPWPKMAREALVRVCTSERLDSDETLRLRLLADLRTIFSAHVRRSMTTDDLLGELWDIPEAPWASYYGRRLEDRDLAKMLRQYGVRSTNLKLKGGSVKKGYRRDALHDVWTRYAPESAE